MSRALFNLLIPRLTSNNRSLLATSRFLPTQAKRRSKFKLLFSVLVLDCKVILVTVFSSNFLAMSKSLKLNDWARILKTWLKIASLYSDLAKTSVAFPKI